MMLIDISPLRNLDFRRLYLSQFISMLGTQMSMVTIPFQIYELTQSTFQTGLVSGIELVCLCATVFWGGALADKLDRRRLLVVSELIMALLVALLAANAMLPQPSLVIIYLLAGLLAAVAGFHRPAFEALTPLLVSKAELPKVSSLTMFKSVFASLVGPSLAGWLVAGLGAVCTFSLDVVSFLISLWFLLQIKSSVMKEGLQAAPDTSVLSDILQGGAYIWQRRDIMGSYLVDFFAMVFCMPQVLFPAFANYYHQSDLLGLLYAAVAAGSCVISLFSGWTLQVKRLGLAITLAAAGWSLSILSIGLLQSFWLIPLGLFFAGACDGMSGIFRMTMWNESIPANFRGRLASFSMLSYNSGPLLGQTIMGLLASKLGLHEALALGGIVSLSMVLLVGTTVRQFRAYNSEDFV